MTRNLIIGMSAVFAVVWAVPAQADQAPLWELGFGAAGLRLPQYRGADHDSTLWLPLPYFVYRGPLLQASEQGARARLLRWGRIEFDLSAALSPPVDAGASPARSGMPPLSATAELGPDVVVRLGGDVASGRWTLHAPLRAAFTLQHGVRMVGWTASPHLQFDRRAGGWQFGCRGGPLWASRAYHEYYYSVEPAYATTDRPAYSAHAGMSGWRMLATVSRRFDRFWVGAFAAADTLAGSGVRASPLVRREHGVSVGVGAAWIFAASAERVSTDD